MKDLLEKLRQRLAKEETGKYLRFMAIPLVVIVLMAVIVIADKPETEQAGTAARDTESTKEAGMASKEETKDALPGGETSAASALELKKDEILEIRELMETYFKAKKSCDGNTLNQVYGGTCSTEQLSKRLARMEEEVKYYQDFMNLTCYTVPGLTEESWVVYACFDIKFRQAEQTAPTMAACYVKKAQDGSYYLEGNVSEEEDAYIRKMNESEEVQQLARDVNSGLRAALENDSNLLSVYGDLTGKKQLSGSQDGVSEAESDSSAEGNADGAASAEGGQSGDNSENNSQPAESQAAGQ